MICELFPFQKQAVNDLRFKAALALNNYRMLKIPQVLSLQAPTGSGKTIIMSSLIEDIFFGTEQFTEQPEAIFVWLSDSPQLNEQSKQKIEMKANKVRIDQCIVITDESFDQEMLDDGHIYFLNTQKLGKSGNLGQHSDSRQYTIWETIENTTKKKADRLYFIIDEAHRGMQGRAAGTATTIMQRFIKGSSEHHLSPIPVVIGMSATAARFNALVGDTNSTLHKVLVSPAQVRASGLLKDRIVITYPDDPAKHNDMAVLQAATEEWLDKCDHWYQYTSEQHYTNVNPVFVIQVTAGTGKKISDTDLDDVLAKIEERTGESFKEGEVVHTFGSIGTIQINGLNVPHIEPVDIADNKKVKVVLFKENLSTGWDCPRAETMMSFRKAEDATYIAQLLGRMVRTPLQCHVQVDDSLNDVRLFLPYFNKDNVQAVIDELQNTEGGEIPTVIEGEALGNATYVPWSIHTTSNGHKPRQVKQVEGQLSLFDVPSEPQGESPYPVVQPSNGNPVVTTTYGQANPVSFPCSQGNPTDNPPVSSTTTNSPVVPKNENTVPTPISSVTPPVAGVVVNQGQISLLPSIDREAIIKFINTQGYLTYFVRSVKINSYLKSLLSLAGILTQNMIYPDANDEVKNEVTDLMHKYIEKLHQDGKYEEYAKQVLEFKLSIKVFDAFGEAISDYQVNDLFTASESDLDRQLRAADAKLGSYGFPYIYARRFLDWENPESFKIDCILFAADDECLRQLTLYAEKKFHELNDNYRKYVVTKSEKCKKQYSDIIADGDIVSKHNFSLPETINGKVDAGGTVYHDHLFVAMDGTAKIKLNGWESGVLAEEQKRKDYVCWLRNPPRQSWSLRIPYELDGKMKEAYPDFIIIRKDDVLGYVMDILEPHNPDFKDNLGKAKGFATYAENETRVGRIQLIRTRKDPSGKDRFVRLDMAKGSVRNKVLAAINNDELDHIFDTDGVFED